DTVDIDVEDGEYEHTRIRLWGVDTPETKHPQTGVMHFGPEAADFTTKLALSKEVTVYLDTENRTRGYYGRLLAYVQLSDSDFLNELLLTEGFAYADLRFDHSLYNKYKQLEAGARSQKKGLWKEVTSDQLPEWRRKF
ncbi:MAG: thermonuclease family protein, partial [Planctomycetota bacterium]